MKSATILTLCLLGILVGVTLSISERNMRPRQSSPESLHSEPESHQRGPSPSGRGGRRESERGNDEESDRGSGEESGRGTPRESGRGGRRESERGSAEESGRSSPRESGRSGRRENERGSHEESGRGGHREGARGRGRSGSRSDDSEAREWGEKIRQAVSGLFRAIAEGGEQLADALGRLVTDVLIAYNNAQDKGAAVGAVVADAVRSLASNAGAIGNAVQDTISNAVQTVVGFPLDRSVIDAAGPIENVISSLSAHAQGVEDAVARAVNDARGGSALEVLVNALAALAETIEDNAGDIGSAITNAAYPAPEENYSPYGDPSSYYYPGYPYGDSSSYYYSGNYQPSYDGSTGYPYGDSSSYSYSYGDYPSGYPDGSSSYGSYGSYGYSYDGSSYKSHKARAAPTLAKVQPKADGN